MPTLSTASHQWATRPADQRFVSLYDLDDHCATQRDASRAVTVSSRRINFEPSAQDPIRGLQVTGPNGHAYAPTHFAFGQLAALAQAPAGYLRTLPAPIAADCLNVGLKHLREVEDVGVLLRLPYHSIISDKQPELVAATGPKYGRVWNNEITNQLCDRFGDGVTGDWRVPGEFGKAVAVTKDNTTLYASDRDMFVFLADETNRIRIPNRRNGEVGSFARGFFLWNSEVGSSSFGLAMFLFDYTCSNRTVWGAEGYKEIRIRHTASAPDRWLEEVTPVLSAYRDASSAPIETALAAAQHKKVEDLAEFLKSRRFAANMKSKLVDAHEREEGRPIESLWDLSVAMTAHAKTIAFQDERITLEREAGKLIDLAL
jgi:hypothetical protein